VEALEDRTVPAFFAAPAFATGADPHAAVAADFAGDGRLDLAVVNEQSNTVSVLAGNGVGGFLPKADYAVGTNPDALVAGDFNGDGRPDLAAVSLTGSVSVLLNNGAGGFLPAGNYAVPSGSHSVAVADFNGDGHPDLVVNHSLLLNNGDGTFGPATALAANGEIVADGDFNGDGKADLASAVPTGPGAESGLISLGNGDGTFQAPLGFALDSGRPMAIAVEDLNGDGKPDLAVTNNKDSSSRFGPVDVQGTVSVLLGNGDGSFRPAVNSPVGFGPTSVVAADVNDDGRPDLVVGNGDSETATVLPGRGDGSFAAATTYFLGTTAGTGLGVVAEGDFNGDGRPDLAATDLGPAFQTNGTVSVVLNRGDGTFLAPVKGAPPPGVTWSQQATAEFNGDGIADLAVLAAPGQVNVELGFGDGSFGAVTALAAGPAATSLAAGDFNGDGLPDLAVTSSSIDPGLATVLLNSSGWDYSQYAGAVGFRISTPAMAAAGTAVPVTVTAIDAAGNPVPGFRGEVHLDSANPGAALPGTLAAAHTFTAADGGTFTFTSNALFAVGSHTLTATAPGLSRASTTVTVTPAAASRFAVAMPASIPAGEAFSFTVTAFDPYGNVATGYAGTVRSSSWDAQAVLPADYTFTAADAGTHGFSATLFHDQFAGSVVATDAGNASVTGAGTTQVLPLAASTLRLSGFPAAVTAGVAEPFTVTALDVYGNVATGYRGRVGFGSSDLNAQLPLGGYTFTAADAGMHTFSGALRTAGVQWLGVSDIITGGSLTDTRSGIVVSPAAAASFAATAVPATTAGVAQGLTLTAYDAFGNVATGYSGTVRFGSSDAQAALPAAYTFTAADAGTHAFSVTLKTAGAQSLTIADTVNPALSVTQTGIVVTPAAAASFSVTGFPATTAGVAQSFTVTARDVYGNVATGYAGTVHFTSSDRQAGLPADYTFTAADAGTHTFTATLKTAGSQSITATDTTSIGVTGSQAGIAVTAAAVSQFAVVVPGSVTQGKSFLVTVVAEDAYGNVVVGYRGKVHFGSSDARAGLPSDYTFAADNGTHTFSVTLNTLGLQTLLVADAANNAIRGSAGTNVTAPVSGGGGGGGGGSGGGGR
jgi:hypothetical protein